MCVVDIWFMNPCKCFIKLSEKSIEMMNDIAQKCYIKTLNLNRDLQFELNEHIVRDSDQTFDFMVLL